MDAKETRKERLARLENLRTKMAELDEMSAFKNSPLAVAITQGDLDAVTALLEAGADVNERSTGFMAEPPLICAVQSAGTAREHTQYRNLISGIDIQFSKLEQAITTKFESRPADAIKGISTALTSLTSMSDTMSDGRDMRRRAADSGNTAEFAPLRPQEAAIVRLLIERGADLEARTELGYTALSSAASSGKPELVTLLLDTGALIEAEDLDGKTPLMLAAEECKPGTVSLLIARGADVNARSKRGGTPLMAAAAGGSRKIVQTLLKAGVEVNAKADDGTTALLCAAGQAYHDVVEQLRAAGAETGFLEAVALGDEATARSLTPEPGSQSPEWGRSLLLWAARAGRADVIRLLHRCGTSADMTDSRGKSPFMRAIMSGDVETVEALLDCGAHPNVPAQGIASFTPLTWAINMGQTEIVRLLVQRGADVNAVGRHGETPLRSAAMKGNVEAARILLEAGADPNQTSGEITMTALGFATMMAGTDMVRLLLEHGAEPNSLKGGRDNVPADVLPGVKNDSELLGMLHAADGTDLHDAAKDGDLARIERLLDAGRNVDGLNRQEHTALREAVDAGQENAVDLLLNRGADPNIPGKWRITPLNSAITKGNASIARKLLQAGADPDVVTDLGTTPLISAARQKDGTRREELVQLLLERGAKVGIQEAAAMGDPATVRSFLDMGIHPDDANAGAVTALMTAAGGGHLEIVETLLRRGAAVNPHDSRGLTALTWAMTDGHLAAGERLLDSGADPNGPADDEDERELSRPPLQASVGSGNAEAVKMLLDRGADPNGRGVRGRSAVHMAASLDDDKIGILELLLERGGDPNQLDDHDFTPLMMASMVGRVALVRTLLAHGADPGVRGLGGQTALQFGKGANRKREIIEMLGRAIESQQA